MKSYFNFLSKNKLYATIEAFGLSVSLGFVILLASYARTEFSVGAHQPLSKELYAVGTGDMVGMTLGTGEEFFPSVPQIESWTRIAAYGDADVTVDGEYWQVQAEALDTNFLAFFDYRLTGCPRERILSGADEVILSESFAKKAFGGENPVGRTVVMGRKNLTVIGTLQDFGPSDVFSKCDIFLSMKVMENVVMKMDQFGSVQTFVRLSDGAVPEEVASQLLDKYCGYWDWYDRDESNGGFLYGSSLTRIDGIYFSSRNVYFPFRHGDRKAVEMLLVVALVLLVSALFNYINLTLAQTGKRAREMATRRLLGESRRGVVRRYVMESLFFTAACFVLGAAIALCCRPWLERLLSAEIVLRPDALTAVSAVLLLCLVSLASGLLPAAMVSRFTPVDVVKGDFRFRSKMVFSKVFIVCQNVLSAVLIAAAMTMTVQMHHLSTLPMGYDTDGLIALDSRALGYTNVAAQDELERRLEALPETDGVGRYVSGPFACGSNGVNNMENEKMSWLKLSYIDSTCFRLLGFKVVEQYSEPLDGTCWFAEETQKRYGITAENRTIGKKDDGTPEYECCGIIADYVSNGAMFVPMADSHNAVRNRNDGICCGMLIRVSGDRKAASAAVADVWKAVALEYVGVPKEAEMDYLDDFLAKSLTGERNTMSLVLVFMVLAILISALGLFAMSVYYTGQQSRQIALRKIFGSDVRMAVWTLSKEFLLLVGVAVAVSVPLCIAVMRRYLEGFYNAIEFPWWVIPLSALLTLAVAGMSILSTTWKTATENPVDKLKQE